MNQDLLIRIFNAVEKFCCWLDLYGELSYDHQSFFAGAIGRRAKALYYRKPLLGTLAVAPMVLLEAFAPSGRTFFWKAQRFPIADAHYAMGFGFLAGIVEGEKHYRRAVHFLNVLLNTGSRDGFGYGWGYPFHWVTKTGTVPAGTPLITTLPYVYEAFSKVYGIDNESKWLEVMRSIADHTLLSYRDFQTQPGAASCAYTPAPDAPGSIVNASAYRAFLLTKAGIELSESRYLEAAERNLNFVLASQNIDGSWYYSMDDGRDFVDHFHTCFVLKALAKVEELTGCPRCRTAIEHGVGYYLKNLFDENALPIPFSRAPRLTVYRRELYDYAEFINLAVLLYGRFPELDSTLAVVLADLLARWQKSDGSFRSRQLILGWDNVPMHRWAQSQLFRSLCFLLSRQMRRHPITESQHGRQQLTAHSID